MTYETPPPPPGPTSTSGGPTTAPPIDWTSLFDDFSTLGKEVIERFSKKATENADRIRKSTYSRDEWFEDVEWFWTNLGTDAARVSEILRTKLPKS